MIGALVSTSVSLISSIVNAQYNWPDCETGLIGSKRCINLYRLSTQLSKSSESFSSSSARSLGCRSHYDSLSGPCTFPGTCWSSK